MISEDEARRRKVGHELNLAFLFHCKPDGPKTVEKIKLYYEFQVMLSGCGL